MNNCVANPKSENIYSIIEKNLEMILEVERQIDNIAGHLFYLGSAEDETVEKGSVRVQPPTIKELTNAQSRLLNEILSKLQDIIKEVQA